MDLDVSAVEQIGHIDYEGDEWYLIVPRYKDDVNITNLDTGEVYTVYNGTAFTVKCNLSDLHSNIEISTERNMSGHKFSPQMGGDGRLITNPDVWDITEYTQKNGDNGDASEDITKAEEPDEPEETNLEPQIVSVQKAYISQIEWYEDTPSMLARSDYSYILLSEKDSESYPKLAEALRQTSNMCKNSMSTEFDNLIGLANEELELYDGFVTQVSNLDMHIRRSDSVAFSVLSDSYMDTMYIEDFRAIHGTSYDTQTGLELVITDVVKDMPRFSEIVEDELSGNMWGGELYSETAVKEYFENRTPYGISWCLDYSGVTIFFNEGDIAESGYGLTSVTVSFEEYPDVFDEKYMQMPDAYMTKLPVSCSNFFDLDGDKKLDEFIVSAYFDDVMGMYSDIYIVSGEDYYEESISAYGYKSYYVKTRDGRNLLYLFVEGSDSWHRLMNLYVYDISGKSIEKLGEVALAPHHDVDYDGTDLFFLPTDPENMYLDYFVSQEGFFYPAFAEFHTVGSDGFPEMLGDGIIMDYPMEEDMG